VVRMMKEMTAMPRVKPAATYSGEDEMRRFLSAIIKQGGMASRGELPIATRAQDKARKAAKRLGLAEYVTGGWRITPAGIRAYNHEM